MIFLHMVALGLIPTSRVVFWSEFGFFSDSSQVSLIQFRIIYDKNLFNLYQETHMQKCHTCNNLNKAHAEYKLICKY